MAGLAELLREAVEAGDWSALRKRLDDAAVLDSSSEAGRRQVEGADAIVRHLSAPGPGEVPVWDAQEWETGVAVTFEWHGESGRGSPPLVRPRRTTTARSPRFGALRRAPKKRATAQRLRARRPS